MSIYTDEIFGPVVCIVRVRTTRSALRLPNEHEYGNGVAIFTRDGDTARDFVSRVQVGMVGVNVPIPVPVSYHLRRLETVRIRRPQPARAGVDPVLHQGQDRHRAVAVGIRDGAEFVIPTMK